MAAQNDSEARPLTTYFEGTVEMDRHWMPHVWWTLGGLAGLVGAVVIAVALIAWLS